MPRNRKTQYRFSDKNKPVTVVALVDITDQHLTDEDREDDVFLAGEVIPSIPHDLFYSWQKAGLVREATPEEAKAAKADAARETAKAA
jgi:hypothetical protein